ncbi:zinc finger protein 414 [Epinephelus lanceolatus]|uniref:zinc finger protein 414 n=1 Tax=Epinephelus lanceolatus TaxID=310571 RepID=UPI001446F69A|nr:zinc finger protein 414 [Epinephelus lanceolatus]
MASGTTVIPKVESEDGGNKRTPCPMYGCRRVYTDTTSLESHIKDHELSAQSLPGKVLLCSTVGCSGSFPNMQKLMEHMRHHHKPNIFFLCESCRTKLRSYRGLLTHLHTCSKVPRSKAKQTEPAAPPPAAATNPNVTPMDVEQKPPLLDSMTTPQQPPSQIPNPDGSLPAAALQLDSAAPPVLGPPFLPKTEFSPQQLGPPQLTEVAPLPQVMAEAPALSAPSNPDGPAAAAPDPPDIQSQQHLTQTRSPEPVHPAPAPAPRSPPGSTAVWKKNQGLSCNRRVLWEHTRGRYTCVQCGHVVTNRKDMTQHISTKHSSNKPAEDAASSAMNI